MRHVLGKGIYFLHNFVIDILKMDWKMEHIGQVIKQELEKQERSVAWLARKLSCDRSNIYRIFQKKSIDTYLLARISIILQHDFFAVFSDSIKSQLLEKE